jgi:hypothetical protein
MRESRIDAGTRSLLWALLRALDRHGVLNDNMMEDIIAEMHESALGYSKAGDEHSAQQVSELIGQVANEVAKGADRPRTPRVSVHLRSFI